jgi:RNA recognition motif-containing protein
LAFDVEPRDIKHSLGKFGHILFAVLVTDKQTKAFKGSAFVKFAAKDSADKCVTAASGSDGLSVKDRICR